MVAAVTIRPSSTRSSQQTRGVACLTAQASAQDPAAVSLGRCGGLKGGKARAAKLTAEQL